MSETVPLRMCIENLEKILNYTPEGPLYMDFTIYGSSCIDISSIKKQLEEINGMTSVCLQPNAPLPFRICNPSKEIILDVYKKEINVPRGELNLQSERLSIQLDNLFWNIKGDELEVKPYAINLHYHNGIPDYFKLIMKELKEGTIFLTKVKKIRPSPVSID